MKTQLTILHKREFWLHPTENWIYNQIVNLPEEISSHVVCDAILEDNRFPISSMHCYKQTPFRSYYGYGLRRLVFRPKAAYLCRLATSLKVDLLHSHFGFEGWANAPIAKKLGLRHVVTFYGLDATRFPASYPGWLKRYRAMFRSIDLVLCEGPHLAKTIALLGCPPEKIRVQHLGVNVFDIPFRPRRWSPDEPLKVLIAASFREKKGIPYALEALGQLHNSVELEINVVGDAGDSPIGRIEKDKILSVIQKYHLEKKVRFHGFLSLGEMHDEAYRNHIFLSPSITAQDGDGEGGAPVALIELAATGMLVVSSFHCDIPEVILHGKGGLLAEEKDVQGLKNHLMWLAEHTDRWEAMLIAARKHIEKEFDARQQGMRLAGIYREVCGQDVR